MFTLSRYWNRLAYLLIRAGRAMIWDYTGRNADLLRDDYSRKGVKDIMCNT